MGPSGADDGGGGPGDPVASTTAGHLGNDRLAIAERDGTVLVGAGSGDPSPTLDAHTGGEVAQRFAADPALAIVIGGDPGAAGPTTQRRGSLPSISELSRRFEPGTAPSGDGTTGPAIVVRVAAALEVGGFDPTFPGLGWADLATRLLAAGWRVEGMEPDAIPFDDRLTAGLTIRDRFQAEARWLALHGTTLDRFRVATLAATRPRPLGRFLGRGQSGSTPSIDHQARRAVRADALRRWRRPAPHETQVGIGRRADWRFLLPAGPRSHTLVLLDRSVSDDWTWLVEDGWTERVSTRADPSDPADVVVIGPGVALDDGLDVLAAGGTACVLRPPTIRRIGPRIGALTEPAAEMRRRGYAGLRRFLVVPDLERPRRFVPLDHPSGTSWLLADAPPLAAGQLSAQARRRRRLATIARARLGTFAGPVATVGIAPGGGSDSGRVEAGADGAWTIAGIAAEHLPPEADDAIVVTSGFDEGSRAVILPLGPGPSPTGVIKVSSRPAYNDNLDAEHRALRALGRRGAPAGLVPTPGELVDVGRLRAGTESYAGRWSAADVLAEQEDPSSRARLLHTVFGAITELAQTTVDGSVVWSAEAFEDYVGTLLDRLDAEHRPSATRGALRSALARRSDEMSGLAIPLVTRHHDLGPWNVMFNEGEGSPVTIVDWEVAPPLVGAATGLAGIDHLYFATYWLHAALATRSLDDEQRAFTFLADSGQPGDPRHVAAAAVAGAFDVLGIDRRFEPLLATVAWAESACSTMTRRADRGGDPGSAATYLDTLARHRHLLLTPPPT